MEPDNAHAAEPLLRGDADEGKGQADVAGVAEPDGPDALRDRALDPRSFGILRLEFFGFFPLSCVSQGVILRLGAHGDRPSRIRLL